MSQDPQLCSIHRHCVFLGPKRRFRRKGRVFWNKKGGKNRPVSRQLEGSANFRGSPPVVDEESVDAAEKGGILAGEFVLVVEKTAGVDRVVPDEHSRGVDGVDSLAEFRQEGKKEGKEGRRNRGDFDVDQITVEIGFGTNGDESFGEKRVESGCDRKRSETEGDVDRNRGRITIGPVIVPNDPLE